MGHGRTLLVSNRLPVALSQTASGYNLTPSSGGLASALREVHENGDGRWIGWAGDLSRLDEARQAQVIAALGERRLTHVQLSAREISLYYDGFSNAVLWPLFHYLLDKVRLEARNEWRTYKAVNERFAEAVAKELRPGDTVWIHDYHLLLVPAYVRRRVPDARIGFFLHVPWPSSDVFRILPFRDEILEGILGADLVGFHTESYRHNFIHSAAKVLGLDIGVDSLNWGDRVVRIGVYPIGIEVEQFERNSPHIEALVQQLRAGTGGKTTLLGVDRLDYTKGVPRRLLAVDYLLEREPQLRNKLHFIQLAVPTREKVEAYAELRRNVNELVGRINSQYGSATGSPVQLLYRSVNADELLALYRAADVMVVTPLRDGMNLVAKEYAAARIDEEGTLVLSEFAGAASELDAALLVNPYDITETALTIRRAMLMPKHEQRVRMRRLRAAVRANHVQAWALAFMDDLKRLEPVVTTSAISSPAAIEAALARLREAPYRILLLDYDGTLVPLQPLPDLAAPDDALLELLRRLAQTPNTEVHVVSGRSRASLEPWLGDTPISLHIEHGFWSRDASGRWSQVVQPPPEFLKHIVDVMTTHASRTPGTLVEQKAASVAFHYRRVDPHLAEARLRSLRGELNTAIGPNAEILDGHKVLEVRMRGVHKGLVVERVLAQAPKGTVVFAAGDDRTDEDLFAALPEDAISVRVGPGLSRAKLRVSSPHELRRMLRALHEGAAA
jgi:trehalose 6-phosphate synthase/phosphatase